MSDDDEQEWTNGAGRVSRVMIYLYFRTLVGICS